MNKFNFPVSEEENGQRIDKFLTEKFLAIKPEITRSKVQSLIENGLVENFKNSSQKIKSGQEISVELPKPKPSHLTAKEIPFEIIFEDDDLLVINKPAGLTVHPGTGNQDDTLVNALLFTHQNKLSTINGEFRPGIVHRLDKDTSGLMLVAKNDFAHNILSEKLKNREIKRNYLAFVYGALSPTKGRIDKNIVRCRNNRLKMVVAKVAGRQAITNYETKEVFLDSFVSLVECRLETGRTHQIRVHLESAKHSLVGDKLYSSCKKNPSKTLDEKIKKAVAEFPRQALHSYKIGFLHPRSEKEMSFEIGLPDDIKELYEILKTN